MLPHSRKVLCVVGFLHLASPQCSALCKAPCLGSLFSYPLISKLVMKWFGCSVSDTRARSTSPTRLTSICAGRTSLCRLTAAVRKETLASAVADAFFHPSTCWGGLVSPVWGHHSTEVLWLLSWWRGSCFPPELSQQLGEREVNWGSLGAEIPDSRLVL